MASYTSNVHHQASVNGDDANIDAFTSGVGLHDARHMTPFTLWSRSGHSDSYELKDCIVNSIKRMENLDRSESEEETDLQGLVSNILDEGDAQGRNLPTGSSLWCPEPSIEDFSTYFQSENTQDNTTFFSNSIPSNAFLQGQMESPSKNVHFPQQPIGGSSHRQWHVGVPNGDRNGLCTRPRRLPPGLPIVKTGNHILSRTPSGEYDLSADLQQANHRPVNDFPQISHVFQQQNDMCSSLFHLHREGHRNGRSATPMTNIEQHLPEDINQSVFGFKSPLAYESNGGHFRAFPNMQVNTQHSEECMDEQWKIPIRAMPPVHTQKQLDGLLWSRKDKAGKPIVKHHGIQGLSGFGNENEYFLQKKNNSPPLKQPNQYQNIINRHQFSNHCTQQYNMKPQEKNRMPGLFGERPQTPNYKSSHFLLNMQRAATEDRMGAMQPSIPLTCTAGSHAHRNLRYTPPKGSVPPGTSPMVSNHQAAALYAQLDDSKYGESYGIGSASEAPLENNEGVLMMQLYLHLDECYEEWRYLEEEWKKTEVTLAKTFPGEWMPPLTSTSPTVSPAKPSGVEDLILNQKKEQWRVECLLYKMEGVCNIPLHAGVCVALTNHHSTLSRISELVGVSQHHHRDRDTVLLVMGLKELAAATRKLRTALWCALQMCLPEPVKTPDRHDVNREETHTHNRPSSPYGGYSFRI
uniref:uncharacterized protein moto n=1 Tax=Doryrhamphus excisus TaxID=161450 RepID=UPI0025AEA61C|nr:uncharacterized protein moto [Doryrhamphus excisus]XP_057905433.1 uncharacterized protein moto [Doryrhamphus excisus]